MAANVDVTITKSQILPKYQHSDSVPASLISHIDHPYQEFIRESIKLAIQVVQYVWRKVKCLEFALGLFILSADMRVSEKSHVTFRRHIQEFDTLPYKLYLVCSIFPKVCPVSWKLSLSRNFSHFLCGF